MRSLAKRLADIYASHADDFSGALLLADRNGVLFTAANGYANLDFRVPNTLDTRFDTASVTKVFTAVAVLQLIEKGLLRFDNKITGIVDLRGTKIPADVTIEHLLTHTSGIADDADEEAGEDYAALFIDKPNYSIRDCIDFLPQFAYKEPLFKAGTNIRYNNCAFVLLGLAIERATGAAYRDYVTENIFKRCGMERSCFQSRDEICPDTAEGYFAVTDQEGRFLKWRKNIYSHPPIGTPDGGAYTTVMDLYHFGMAIQNNVLLGSAYSNMLMRPQCSFSRPNQYGKLRFGYALENIEAREKIFCVYKDGLNNGVEAMLSYYPQQDIFLHILSNRAGAFWEMNGEMRETIGRE